MPSTIGGIGIDPQGETLAVSITPAAKVYTDAAGTTLATFPVTITALTKFYMSAAQTYTVSTLFAGVEIAGPAGGTVQVLVEQGTFETIAPSIDRPGEETAHSGSYEALGAAKSVVASATSGTAVQAAITALGAAGGTINLAAGNHTWDVVPAIPPNLTGLLRIIGAGRDATTITLSSAAPRAFDATKLVDYDTCQNVELGHFTVDANNTTGSHHVIFGGYVNGTLVTRLNFARVWIHDIRALNMPIDPATSGQTSRRVGITTYTQFDPTDALGSITDITVQRIRLEGAGEGVGIAAYGATAGVGSTANCFLDRILVEDIYHDLGSLQVQSGTPPAYSVIIGGRGYGGSAQVRRVYSRYSMDVGVEIDAMTDVVVEDCTAEDSYNTPFYQTNFQAPANTNAQRVVWNRCHARRILQTNTVFSAFKNFRTNSINPASAVYRDCTYYKNMTETNTVGGDAMLLQGGFDKTSIENFKVDMEGGLWSTAGTAAGPVPIRLIALAGATSYVTINGLRMRVVTQRDTGAGNVILDGIQILGTGASGVFALNFNDLQFELLAGGGGGGNLSNGSLRCIDIGTSACTVRGRIVGMRMLPTTGDSTPVGVQIRGTATLTINWALVIEELDLINATGSAVDVKFSTGNENKDKVFFYRNQWKTFPAAAAAVSVTASPFDYQNLDGYAETVTVLAGTVSKVELSLDGANYFDTGVIAGAFFLNNADHLRVTYSVAPTMEKLPVK